MITKLQHKKRPLPLGEGWGEGLARTETTPTFFFPFSLSFAPSPWPSPRGRGNKTAAHFVGAVLMMLCVFASAAFAQTSSFTYQGRLTDGGTAANGNYDLQFGLFDSLSGGTQVGSTQTLNTVAVSNGVFTVSLDFGASSFSGASRFLEISARPSGAGSFTLLTPRQPVTATPYAVRSANASAADALSSACAGCVQDGQINSVSGNKVSGTVASATNATNATN